MKDHEYVVFSSEDELSFCDVDWRGWIMDIHAKHLKWMAHRLVSMEPLELPFRVQEWWRKKDVFWTPEPMNSTFQNTPVPKWPFVPKEIPKSTLLSAEKIMEQGVRFLGESWNAEELWKWGWDPQTKDFWPKESAHKIEIRFADMDIKPAWELLKLQHVQILAWAAKGGNDDALKLCLDGLRSWLDWDTPYKGIGYSSGIECACRMMSLIWVSTAIDTLSKNDQRRIWAALHHHASWIIRFPSRFSSANNHRIAELSALIILGRLAPKGFLNPIPLEDELVSLLPRQQYCDGVGTEQSLSYQALCLEWLLYVQCVSPRIQPTLHRHLHQGAKFLVFMMDEYGNTPQIGDHDNCVVLRSVVEIENSIASICGACAHVIDDSACVPPSYKPDLRLFILGKTPISSTCIHQSMHYPKGGYTILRNRDVLLIMDHGPLGFDSTAGHGHADALALWMHYHGEPVWIDWGMYRYNGSQSRRSFARSTKAHNTVVIGEQDQSIMRGPFNWSKRAVSRVCSLDLHEKTVTAEHQGYAWKHRRKVTLDENGISIEDQLLGDGECNEQIEVCFWLAGSFSVAPCTGGWIVSKDNRNIATFVLKNSQFQQNIRETKVFGVSYNTLSPAHGLYWSAKGVQKWTIEWKWMEKK